MTDDTLRAALHRAADELPEDDGSVHLSDVHDMIEAALAASAPDEPVFAFDEANAIRDARPAVPEALDVERHTISIEIDYEQRTFRLIEYAALQEQTDDR